MKTLKNGKAARRIDVLVAALIERAAVRLAKIFEYGAAAI